MLVFFAKTEVVACGCRLWTASTNKYGYGKFGIGGGGAGWKRAHRVAWFLEYGVWPSEFLLHSCDTPACVEVKHLFEGDNQANVDDMVAKGRQSRGVMKIKTAKLTEDQVRAIRVAEGSKVDIAEMYGVTRRNIGMIQSRQTWKHVQ